MENDERARVAAKLREYASWDDEGCLVDCQEWGESVLNLIDCGDTEGECYATLADLIDPTLKSSEAIPNSHPNCGTEEATTSRVPECDRAALLALAEDVDGAAEDSGGFKPLADMLHDIARTIRDACGVTEDD